MTSFHVRLQLPVVAEIDHKRVQVHLFVALKNERIISIGIFSIRHFPSLPISPRQ